MISAVYKTVSAVSLDGQVIGVLHYQLVHDIVDYVFVPPTKLQDFE